MKSSSDEKLSAASSYTSSTTCMFGDIGQAEDLVIAGFNVRGEVSQTGGEAVPGVSVLLFRGQSSTPPCSGNIIDELICDIISEIITKDAPVSIVKEEFSCTDNRYRPKTIRETAMSLFIFSPRTSMVSNFINSINSLKRKCRYEKVGESDQVIRIDFVFPEESDQKSFKNNFEHVPFVCCWIQGLLSR